MEVVGRVRSKRKAITVICGVVAISAIFTTIISYNLVGISQGRFLLSGQDRVRGSSEMVDKSNSVIFHTSAKKCQQPVEIQNSDYKSQSREDKKLMKWFGTLCEGSYIEMGALDGVRYSNSYVFNKALKWKGVMIELLKGSFDKLVWNRPSEIATIHAGVCDVPQTLHYFGDGAIAGIYEFSAPTFRDQWWANISLDDPRVKEIDCDTLDGLLRKHAPANVFFDFFSLDVEGAEFSVLESVDWNRTGFGIIFVEADEHNELKNIMLRKLIESQGYTFLEAHERSYWFVNDHFHEIYKDLVY